MERAVAKVGRDNVTGEAMRQALLDNVYTEQELLGALPTLDFDARRRSRSARSGRLRKWCGTARSCPSAAAGIHVPAITKW